MIRYGVKWNRGLLKAWRCWDLTEEVTVKEVLVNLKEMENEKRRLVVSSFINFRAACPEAKKLWASLGGKGREG